MREGSKKEKKTEEEEELEKRKYEDTILTFLFLLDVSTMPFVTKVSMDGRLFSTFFSSSSVFSLFSLLFAFFGRDRDCREREKKKFLLKGEWEKVFLCPLNASNDEECKCV